MVDIRTVWKQRLDDGMFSNIPGFIPPKKKLRAKWIQAIMRWLNG